MACWPRLLLTSLESQQPQTGQVKPLVVAYSLRLAMPTYLADLTRDQPREPALAVVVSRHVVLRLWGQSISSFEPRIKAVIGLARPHGYTRTAMSFLLDCLRVFDYLLAFVSLTSILDFTLSIITQSGFTEQEKKNHNRRSRNSNHGIESSFQGKTKHTAGKSIAKARLPRRIWTSILFVRSHKIKKGQI